jgi:flagellar biosynthetic protein FliR
MVNSASLPLGTLYAFLLVLTRASGAFVFVPMPGVSSAPQQVRVILSLVVTMALYPVWPTVTGIPNPGQLVGWMICEAALGIAIGLIVGFLAEAFVMFGQLTGLQAGYSFASTIDPTTQADSSIFIVLSQTIAGLLFFAMGLHREVLRALARSLELHAPGTLISMADANTVIRLGSTIFSTGLRLAFPVLALLIMVDIALALLGRINSHLQLLSLAFPIKMLAALAMMATMAAILPRVYQTYASRLFAAVPALIGQ